MGWDIIETEARGSAQKNTAALVCSITRAGKPTTPPRLVLLFRPAVRAGAAWLTLDARIRVERGTGAERGMLRLSPDPGAKHKAALRGAQKPGTACALMLRGLQSCPTSVCATQVPCDYDYNDTVTPPWLLVTIPVALRAILWEPQPIVGGIGALMDAERARNGARR
jgi:hypothetical protein